MKYNYLVASVLLSFFSYTSVKAQGSGCEVLLKSIAGTYTGNCSRGKASGKGISEGTDKYTGEFKAGYPEGKGTYQWKNGDTFAGLWVKGNREGKGTMTYKREGKADSVVTGTWIKDAYAGNYEHPYVIYQKGPYIARVEARRNTNSSENTITFNISSASAGVNRISGGTTGTATASLGDIAISKGSYGQLQDGPSSARGTSKRLAKVSYPFRALYRVGTQDLDMEIMEPGDWTINISINQ